MPHGDKKMTMGLFVDWHIHVKHITDSVMKWG